MSRTVLDKELQGLTDQIIRLGSLVDDPLGGALEALEVGDLAKAGIVSETDAIVDSQRAAVVEHTIRVLTFQQPLGGPDLRLLTATLSVASSLKCMCDLPPGIA